jgi:two-component system chemotaxis sensor kinase CheA
MEDVPFTDMLSLTVEIEKLSLEKEGFKATIEQLQALTGHVADEDKRHERHVLVDALAKAAEKAAFDMGKKVKLIVEEVDVEAVEKGPIRIMKEVLIQLIRNSVVHGIESPQERQAAGKNQTGSIRLLVKLSDKKIHVKLKDDGKGLDYSKIQERAIRQKIIRREDKDNKDLLIKAIFTPGFSTAEDDGMHAGRGVGLNLVRDRVREAKGTIKLQSEPGKGTIFNIFFPMVTGKAKSSSLMDLN